MNMMYLFYIQTMIIKSILKTKYQNLMLVSILMNSKLLCYMFQKVELKQYQLDYYYLNSCLKFMESQMKNLNTPHSIPKIHKRFQIPLFVLNSLIYSWKLQHSKWIDNKLKMPEFILLKSLLWNISCKNLYCQMQAHVTSWNNFRCFKL